MDLLNHPEKKKNPGVIEQVAPYQRRYRWVMLSLLWFLYVAFSLVCRAIAPLVTPVAALLYFLMTGWSAGYAAGLSAIIALVVFIFLDFSPAGLRQRVIVAIKATAEGGRSLAQLIPMIVCANALIMFINISGLAIKLGSSIMTVAEVALFLSLFLQLGAMQPHHGAGENPEPYAA